MLAEAKKLKKQFILDNTKFTLAVSTSVNDSKQLSTKDDESSTVIILELFKRI